MQAYVIACKLMDLHAFCAGRHPPWHLPAANVLQPNHVHITHGTFWNNLQPRLNKFVLLRLEAYKSGLEAGIGTCRDIFGFLRFSAFI